MRVAVGGDMARRGACAVLALALLCPLAHGRHDDDFAFDNNDDSQVDISDNQTPQSNGLKRLWGVPDTAAYVGHLFRMEIPKEAFSGDVHTYKVRSDHGRLPGWLAVDSKHGLISGIPQAEDLGAHSFTVTAHGRAPGVSASDTFTVEVKKSEDKPQSKYGTCSPGQSRLVLVLLVDANFHQLPPRQRIRSLMDLASFMALDGDEFSIAPLKADSLKDNTVLMSGPGLTTKRKGSSTTAIYLNVGCGDKLWPRHKVLVSGVREQCRDGTIAQLTRLPVLGWRLVTVRAPPRLLKIQLPVTSEGSGWDDYADGEDDGDYSGYGDDEDDYGKADFSPVDDPDDKVRIEPFASETNNFGSSQSPPVNPRVLIVPDETPTSTEQETQTVIIRASNEIPTSPSPPTVASPPPTEPTTQPTTVVTTPATVPTTPTTIAPLTLPPTTQATTLPPPPPPPPTTTDQPETTLPEVTTQETEVFTERTSPISGQTTETVTLTSFPLPSAAANQPPSLKHHMKKLAITAGKAFRYIIPADLFTDPEDGSSLSFTMFEADSAPLSNHSWIQFMPDKREVYGLPLESHVSRWNFIVEAKDSEGEVARGPLDITVQQHKGARTINHQFIIQFKLNKTFQHSIDWQISALEGLVNLFRDTDMDHLTVLNATQAGDLCEFVWTNDTLPKDPGCPMDDINRLMKIMESDTDVGSPSAGLTRAMTPDLKVSRVWWRGLGACESAAAPPPPAPPAPAPESYPPVTRNQVDHLTATVGHLLVYKVPEDTFYDPEDGNTRRLRLSLRYSDRSELPRAHWLQFDANNQEFYGLPAGSDVGSTQYQLVAEDSTKKSAYDSLIVEVVKAPKISPPVEFQMTMDYPFPMLAYNANTKRKVVEKLAQLFGQTDTESIRIQNITDNPTTIIWYNTSLPMDRCPTPEIEELRKMIIVDERNIHENVDQVFDKDFKVMSIRLIMLGLCAEQNTKVVKQMPPPSGTSKTLQKKGEDGGYTEYLVTFIIPIIVVVCMILVAGVVACVLYRRRKTGKMSVGDEEERQAFRSKGIPVIFQDELEDQAGTEPLHKSPVIMREEKPPLLPPAPDYRNSAPYRPPPPVAPTSTPPRPKATPTYRKPPPYVPP
ncbi:dystroglycan 1 isoform X4 [Plutella xylostella]|uniref:dystroglycan 1 isoform X4 n=1 Tax=Plutella xylostella TaxID=51655 RepID=UPI0020324DBD|nr:dystroglycan 1 isoform X4 [Plutella xylostella]